MQARFVGAFADSPCSTTVEEFRVEQVVWGAVGMTSGALLLALGGAVRGQVDAVLVGGAAICGAVGGLLARDWRLTRRLERRERTMLAEFPVVADLLALAVLAGEAPAEALGRVARLTCGEPAQISTASLPERDRGRR